VTGLDPEVGDWDETVHGDWVVANVGDWDGAVHGDWDGAEVGDWDGAAPRRLGWSRGRRLGQCSVTGLEPRSATGTGQPR
jgi:hypothetical protein